MATLELDEIITPDQVVSSILLLCGLLEHNKKRLLETVDDAVILVNINEPDLLDEETRKKMALYGDQFRKRIENKVYGKSISAITELADAFEQGVELMRSIVKNVEAVRDGRPG